jgi:hypothetical protein
MCVYVYVCVCVRVCVCVCVCVSHTPQLLAPVHLFPPHWDLNLQDIPQVLTTAHSCLGMTHGLPIS